jgi:hypothetical protein
MADPDLAGRVLGRLDDLDLQQDGPDVVRDQKILRGAIGLEDPALVNAALDVLART